MHDAHLSWRVQRRYEPVCMGVQEGQAETAQNEGAAEKREGPRRADGGECDSLQDSPWSTEHEGTSANGHVK